MTASDSANHLPPVAAACDIWRTARRAVLSRSAWRLTGSTDARLRTCLKGDQSTASGPTCPRAAGIYGRSVAGWRAERSGVEHDPYHGDLAIVDMAPFGDR